MELNEALDVAQQMQSHYAAFSKLSEVITILRSFNADEITRLTIMRDGISKDISDKTTELQTIMNNIASVSADSDLKRTELQQELQHDLLSHKAAFDDEINRYRLSIQNQEAALTNDLASKSTAHDKKMAEMIQEEEDLQTQIETLKNEAEAFKNKILSGVS